jgi:hypothetical protein
MSRMKSMGTSHETSIKNWLREHGWPYADRKTLAGAADEGDLRLSERIPFVIEAKTAKSTTDRASLGTFVKELEAEVVNANAEGGAVIFKKKGTTDVGQYYAIMPVHMLNELLLKAYHTDI